MPGEFEYIDWIRSQQGELPGNVLVGPGDDCAVVRTTDRLQLITTDMLMDGVDFRVGEVEPRRIGRKAMAVNLSDIAAMAGVPKSAVVSVALPAGQRSLAEELYLGMAEMAARFEVAIVGGDTNSWAGPLVINVTLLGEATARGPVTRSGAEPGDWLFITGPLGNSIAGHHLDFTPRVREALLLHDLAPLKAMIDISDGLTADLQHILDESRCGAVLDAIPLRDGATLAGALGDGEDFELLFAVAASDGEVVSRHATRIGGCVESGLWLMNDGRREELKPRGWSHSV